MRNYAENKGFAFQSTLRRTERQPGDLVEVIPSDISIHAPTNGATFCGTFSIFILCISIHAPTNGATYRFPSLCNERWISIHAPTNGATSEKLTSPALNLFQSTLRRTERRAFPPTYLCTRRFQSTLRRTERPLTSTFIHLHQDFNPRSDERSDSNFAQKNLKNYTKPLNNIIVFYN